jgi:hypothetical protein
VKAIVSGAAGSVCASAATAFDSVPAAAANQTTHLDTANLMWPILSVRAQQKKASPADDAFRRTTWLLTYVKSIEGWHALKGRGFHER